MVWATQCWSPKFSWALNGAEKLGAGILQPCAALTRSFEEDRFPSMCFPFNSHLTRSAFLSFTLDECMQIRRTFFLKADLLDLLVWKLLAGFGCSSLRVPPTQTFKRVQQAPFSPGGGRKRRTMFSCINSLVMGNMGHFMRLCSLFNSLEKGLLALCVNGEQWISEQDFAVWLAKHTHNTPEKKHKNFLKMS